MIEGESTGDHNNKMFNYNIFILAEINFFDTREFG